MARPPLMRASRFNRATSDGSTQPLLRRVNQRSNKASNDRGQRDAACKRRAPHDVSTSSAMTRCVAPSSPWGALCDHQLQIWSELQRWPALTAWPVSNRTLPSRLKVTDGTRLRNGQATRSVAARVPSGMRRHTLEIGVGLAPAALCLVVSCIRSRSISDGSHPCSPRRDSRAIVWCSIAREHRARGLVRPEVLDTLD